MGMLYELDDIEKAALNEGRSEAAQIDPAKTICVVKHNGKEVGRIAATALNASDYIAGLVRHYREGVTVDYEQNATEAMVSRLFARRGK